jgi:Restriction endonuclease BglII
MLDSLKDRGFEVETLSHAKAILSGDFPEVAAEIETILLASTIPIEEIVGSGGETKGTQRLRRALREKGWRKHNFTVQRVIDERALESQSHEAHHLSVSA